MFLGMILLNEVIMYIELFVATAYNDIGYQCAFSK